MRLRISPEAAEDIYRMHEFGSVTYGIDHTDAYVSGMMETLELIRRFPEMAQERAEIRPPIRLYRYRAHNIFYDVEDSEVIVVRLLHHTADWMRDL